MIQQMVETVEIRLRLRQLPTAGNVGVIPPSIEIVIVLTGASLVSSNGGNFTVFGQHQREIGHAKRGTGATVVPRTSSSQRLQRLEQCLLAGVCVRLSLDGSGAEGLQVVARVLAGGQQKRKHLLLLLQLLRLRLCCCVAAADPADADGRRMRRILLF